MSTPYFDVPLDLAHAETVAARIKTLLAGGGPETEEAMDQAITVWEILSMRPHRDPPRDQALRIRDQAAAAARLLVVEIERRDLGHDRLGQCVRNLFECLELGQEGAIQSLRAGENKDSMQRPI